MKAPVRSVSKSTVLRMAVPPKALHEDKKWFHAHLSRHQAETMLRQVQSDGAFFGEVISCIFFAYKKPTNRLHRRIPRSRQ
jgi:hypothetical protein